MTQRDLGKFQKLQQSFIFSVRNNAKRRGKWVTGRSASLLHGDVAINGNNLDFNFKMGGGSDQEYAQFYQLETGRKAGSVPRGFADIILQWSRDKRLSFSSEKERKSFAWATARKIANEGTRNYRDRTFNDIFDTLYRRFTNDVDRYVQMFLDDVTNRELVKINKNFE